MALPFGRAVMQIEANDDQLRRDLKDAERIVEVSTANMQADLSGLTVATNQAGSAMGGTSEAAGVLGASMSLAGGRMGAMGGQLVSLTFAMRQLVVSTAAADAAILSFGKAAAVALIPLAKIAAVIGVAVGLGFALREAFDRVFVGGETAAEAAKVAEDTQKVLQATEARLASRQLAKISEAKVLAEQAKIKEEALQKELAIAKQLEQVEKKRLAEAAALLKQLEAQRDAKRAAFIAAAGPQTIAGAQRAIADLIKLEQARENSLRIMQAVTADIGKEATRVARAAGLLGPQPEAGATAQAGSVNFVRAGAFSTATLARGSLGGTSGRKQEVRDTEGNRKLDAVVTAIKNINIGKVGLGV